MNIIFMGTPDFSVPILKEIAESNHHIISVITQPDKRRGRGNKLSFSPVKEIALKYKIPVLTPTKLKNNIKLEEEIKLIKADLIVVVAYGQILPKEILEIPEYGCWNIHASLLPKWRGAAPIQWSIINGDMETGIGIMLMEEGLDTGPILIEKKIKIEPNENASELCKRLSKLGSELIIKAIDIIETNLPKNDLNTKLILHKQNTLKRKLSYARLIKKEDHLIKWDLPSTQIHNLILGHFPNSYSIINNKRIKILEAIPFDKFYLDSIGIKDYKETSSIHNNISPGRIIGNIDKIGLLTQTNDIPILITKIKIEGKEASSGNSMIQQINSLGSKFNS